MPSSEVAFRIFLILLPGFAAAYLVQLLVVRAKQSDFEKVVESFLFSFLIYITYYLCHPRQPLILPFSSTELRPVIFRTSDLLSLLLIALGYAVLFVLFVNKDAIRYLRSLGFTERTSRSSIWNDVFEGDEQGTSVQVELADGRSVQGIVRFYSDTAEEASVFLVNARWIEGEELVSIDGPGILLTKEAKILSISFLYPPAD